MKCETKGCPNPAVCRVVFDSGATGCYCAECMEPTGETAAEELERLHGPNASEEA